MGTRGTELKIHVSLNYLNVVIAGVAFLVALHQNRALLGSNGLLPVDKYLDTINKHSKGRWLEKLQHAPTLLWFLDYKHDLNALMDYLAIAGLILAGFVTMFGCANILHMLALWLIYHSIVNIGQRWWVHYNFETHTDRQHMGSTCIMLNVLCIKVQIYSHFFSSKTQYWWYLLIICKHTSLHCQTRGKMTEDLPLQHNYVFSYHGLSNLCTTGPLEMWLKFKIKAINDQHHSLEHS